MASFLAKPIIPVVGLLLRLYCFWPHLKPFAEKSQQVNVPGAMGGLFCGGPSLSQKEYLILEKRHCWPRTPSSPTQGHTLFAPGYLPGWMVSGV